MGDRFAFISAVKAATIYLNEIGRPATTLEIVQALVDGGFTTMQTPYAAIYKALHRSKKMTKSDGKWSLKAWEQK